MSELILKVSNISKSYLLDQVHKSTFKEELMSRIAGVFRSNIKSSPKEFLALHDISFELNRGDVLGIIGENGSGKSTLLKLLSETAAPSSGEIEIHGSVSSILEIGTGFHPDLSGRENIYFNGSLLGMNDAEIASKFDQIVDFSGISNFIDTPVKYYSSGMYVRLAFSVASHLETDIMLLDEVSSVGDIEFRIRSLNKIKELVQNSGVTIILVTHGLNEVVDLCNKCIMLENGEIRSMGNPISIAREYYEKVLINHVNTSNKNLTKSNDLKDGVTSGKRLTESSGNVEFKIPSLSWEGVEEAPGTEDVKISSVEVRALNRKPSEKIHITDRIEIVLEFWKLRERDRLELSLLLFDQIGNPVFSSSSVWSDDVDVLDQAGLYKSSIIIPGNILNYGVFSLTFVFSENTEKFVAEFPKLIYFRISVDEAEKNLFLNLETPGPMRPKLEWRQEKL